MKNRKAITIIGIALALIVFFASLPMQAQTNYPWSNSLSIDDFAYEGVNADTGKWEFSWTSIEDEDLVYFQFKGGGITSVWTSVSSFDVARSNGKTSLSVSPLSNEPTGQTFHFRVAIRTCDDDEDPEGSCSRVGWASVEVTF